MYGAKDTLGDILLRASLALYCIGRLLSSTWIVCHLRFAHDGRMTASMTGSCVSKCKLCPAVLEN
jgi:hypothetical protein